MDRDRMMELRVLTGTHAGARAALPEGSQVLGSSLDCDLILSDEGVADEHARLEAQEDGSFLLYLLDGDAEPLHLHPGTPTSIGPVRIAIDTADAPWPEVEDEPSEEDAAEGDASADAWGRDDDLGPDEDELRPASRLLSPALLARLMRPLLVALGALVAGICVIVTWRALAPQPTQPAAVAPAAPVRLSSAAEIDQIRKALQPLDLGSRVRIETPAGRPPVVHASFLSEDEAVALASALSRLTPRPGLRLDSETEVKEAVTDAVERRGTQMGIPLSARYLGQGQFAIEGRVLAEADKETLLEALRKEFPAVVSFEDRLTSAADEATRMLELLRREGIGQITGEWKDGVLQLRVRLPATQVPAWERLLTDTVQRYNLPFHATLDLTQPKNEPISNSLPFSIRSVVSGPSPYVVLADGSKLTLEGQRQGWRLNRIDERAVVFEDRGGQQVSIPR